MAFFEAAAEVNWGTFPSYFGGMALLLTAWTMYQGRRADIREQANKVAAWVDEKEDGKTVILMKNASDLPITSARVEPAYRAKTGISLAKDDAAATRHGKTIYLTSGVGPGQTVTVRNYEGETVRVVGFSFMDARGQRWRRVNGKLFKVHYRKVNAKKE